MYYITSNEWIHKILFENGGKNMSFIIKNDNLLDKYNKIWGKTKETLNIKFHTVLVYDEKYIKA